MEKYYLRQSTKKNKENNKKVVLRGEHVLASEFSLKCLALVRHSQQAQNGKKTQQTKEWYNKKRKKKNKQTNKIIDGCV